MNGYSEIVAMLLVFCAKRGITADSDELHTWVRGYFDVRFSELEAEGLASASRLATMASHSAFDGRRCHDRSCPWCTGHHMQEEHHLPRKAGDTSRRCTNEACWCQRPAPEAQQPEPCSCHARHIGGRPRGAAHDSGCAWRRDPEQAN